MKPVSRSLREPNVPNLRVCSECRLALPERVIMHESTGKTTCIYCLEKKAKKDAETHRSGAV